MQQPGWSDHGDFAGTGCREFRKTGHEREMRIVIEAVQGLSCFGETDPPKGGDESKEIRAGVTVGIDVVAPHERVVTTIFWAERDRPGRRSTG